MKSILGGPCRDGGLNSALHSATPECPLPADFPKSWQTPAAIAGRSGKSRRRQYRKLLNPRKPSIELTPAEMEKWQRAEDLYNAGATPSRRDWPKGWAPKGWTL